MIRVGDSELSYVNVLTQTQAHNLHIHTPNRTPQGVVLCICVTLCDKDKARAFSQQGLYSVFLLL